MATTVRIDAAAHAAPMDIARAERVSLTEALSHAIETHRRKMFLDGLVKDFAELAGDPTPAEETAERLPWETASQDGLEREPPHPDARAASACMRQLGP